MTEQTQLSVAMNYEQHIYMFNVHKATPLNVYHRPIPHNKNRSSSPVFNILLCDVLYRQHLHQCTQNNKTKQLLSLVEIFRHFVLSSTREKITKLLQNKFHSPSCFVKSTPSLMKPISHKNSEQRNTKYLNPKKDCIHHSTACFFNSLSTYN